MVDSVQTMVNYTYAGTWGDLLTGYNSKTITYAVDGTWLYTKEHIRKQITISNSDILR